MLKLGDKIPPPQGISLRGALLRVEEDHIPQGGMILALTGSVRDLRPFDRLKHEFHSLNSMVVSIIGRKPPKPPISKELVKLADSITLVFDPTLSYLRRLGVVRRTLLGWRVVSTVLVVDRKLIVREIISSLPPELMAVRALLAVKGSSSGVA
ncbi:MAG: hypothetical protein F7B20_00130 [Aeropyrum sp.]|nr:hypothetical protein [Aeropyrum sp.]MCE4615933.1 hypothetical protein [Aeropyrum sp.]